MPTRARITEHERARRARGFGTVLLGDALAVSHAYVSRIEGGLTPASASYRKQASQVLGVPESVLFDERGSVR